ncbi:hypothetical protein AB0D46_14010 [Streptomyces sp. NPDC048383]|uniref:hypothetical protein n=1 Tax=Streptomyces sp. NPDC048383 TaxID=3155386 RepID=UPI0034475D35
MMMSHANEVRIPFLFCSSPQAPGIQGVDRVKILWDGEEIWQGEAGTGETNTPEVTRPLLGSGTLALAVRPAAEGSVWDVIGSMVLSEADLGAGIQTARFVKSGADYELSYEVAMDVSDDRP